MVEQFGVLIEAVKSPEAYKQALGGMKQGIKAIQAQLRPVRFTEVRKEHDEINSTRAKNMRRLTELSAALDRVFVQTAPEPPKP